MEMIEARINIQLMFKEQIILKFNKSKQMKQKPQLKRKSTVKASGLGYTPCGSSSQVPSSNQTPEDTPKRVSRKLTRSLTLEQFESLDPKSRYELLQYDKKIEIENEKIIKWKEKKDIALSEIDLIEDFLFSGTDALLKADQSVTKSLEKTQKDL